MCVRVRGAGAEELLYCSAVQRGEREGGGGTKRNGRAESFLVNSRWRQAGGSTRTLMLIVLRGSR